MRMHLPGCVQKIRILLFTLCILFSFTAISQSIKVLIAAADNPTWVNDVKAKLAGTGKFAAVDVFDSRNGTPSVTFLKGYDAVFVWNDNHYQDATTFGNNLASYIDAGGGLVLSTFGNTTWQPLGGNFANSVYQAMIPASYNGCVPCNQTLGSIQVPGHPLLNGVSSFNGNYSWQSLGTTLAAGAYTVANWSSGLPLIVAKENVGVSGARRVDLNFFPPSSDTYSSGWYSNTNGTTMMANALEYVANSAGALNFDGSNDYVSVPSAYPSSAEISIEAWVRPTALNGLRVIANHDGWSTGYAHLQFNNDKLEFALNPFPNKYANFTFTTGNWYHLAVVYSSVSKTVSFYVNGSLTNTETYSSSVPVVGGVPFTIGAWNQPGFQRFFMGDIDEVRIWKKALCAAEVSNNKNCQLSNGTGLHAYYNFNHGSINNTNTGVTTLEDKSGNGRHGTLNNFALTGTTSNWVAGKAAGTCGPADVVAPLITCPSNKTLASCETMIPNYISGTTATDNCTPSSGITISQSPVAGTSIALGATVMVTMTATDGSGNSSSCSFTVTRPNETPVAVNDAAQVCQGTSVSVSVLDNDSHPQGKTLAINDFTQPSVGTVTKSGNNLVYTAPAGYSGPVTFNYTIKSSDATLANTENGHYYEWVPAPSITWNNARAQAATKTYNGLQGYLVTITSATEMSFVSSKLLGQGWMGASDLAYEGTWRWVTGPEGLENGGLGRHFSNQSKINSGNCSANKALGINGNYANWGNGEPNDCGAYVNQYSPTDPNRGGEHWAHFFGAGLWNDYPNNVGGNIQGYVVEYGGLEGCIPALTATATVTIEVKAKPVVTVTPSSVNICSGTTTTLTASGATSYQWSNGANTAAITAAAGTYTVIGTTNGCASTVASATVTATDNVAPVPDVASLPTITAECGASVVAPTATDNCSGLITGTTTDPVSYNTQGTFTINWRYDDRNGNVTTQTQTVVVDDVTPPVIACPFNITVTAQAGQCGAVVNYSQPSATDNCGSGTLPTTLAGHTYMGTFGGHTYFISNTATVPDTAHARSIAAGGHLVTINSAAENDFVSAMNSNRIWIGYSDRSVEGTFAWVTNEPVTYTKWNSGEPNNAGNEDWAVINWGPNGTWNDWLYTSLALYVIEFEGGNIPTTQTAGLGSGSMFPVGVTTETWQAVDAGGNVVTCSFTVTVTDNQAPVPVVANLPNATGECAVTVAPPRAMDNCAGIVVGTTNNPTVYNNQGTYNILWTYNDGKGNVSTQNQTVVVDDVTAPVPNVTSLPTVTAECSVTVTRPSATDNCKGNIIGTTTNAITYNQQGTYTITWTYNDGNGNVATQNQTVIVKDVTAPVVSCPSPITVNNDPGKCEAFVTVPAPVISDNCNVVCNTEGLDEYATGDVTGKSPQWTLWPGYRSAVVTSERFLSAPNSLKVTGHPNGGPVDQVFKLGNQTTGNWILTFNMYIPFGKTGYYNLQHTESLFSWAHQVKFNSNGIGVLNTAGLNNNFNYPQDQWFEVKQVINQTTDQTSLYVNGVHVRTWQFSRHTGGTALNNQLGALNFFPISNTKYIGAPEPDTTAQPLAYIDDITLCGDATQIGTYVSRRYSKVYPVGTTPAKIIISDLAGNSVTCSATTVTVVDAEKPRITSPSAVSVNADNGSCAATGVALGTPVTADNCGVASVTNDAPASFPVGATTVTWTVTDIHGNVSRSTQKVSVTDNQNPILTCTTDKFFCYSGTQYSIGTLLGATDNCGIASITYVVTGATSRSGSGNNASGTFNVGTSTITWTVTDVNGNTSSCSSTVTINPPIGVTIPDAVAYSAGVQPNTVYVGYGPAQLLTYTAMPSGGTAPYTYSWSTGATSQSITVSPTSVGVHNYTVTITDAKNCTATFTKSVTVVDVRCGNKNDKVLVCHKTGSASNPYVQICIAPSAVATHLANGSYLGACTNNAVTRTSKPAAEATARVLMAYPNPSQGNFNLQLKGFTAGKVTVQVLNSLGKTVMTKDVNVSYATQDETLNLQGVAAGIYQVRVVGVDGVSTTAVVIVR